MFNKLVSARNSKKGFTLIELMVVVAIIAILAAIAIPGYAAYKRSAKIGVVKNAINSMIDMVNASEATDQLKIDLEGKTLAQVAANYSAEYDHVDMTAEFLDVAGKEGTSNYYTLVATDNDLFDLYVD